MDPRRGLGKETGADQLLERLGRLRQQRSGGHRHDDVVGCLPAELFHHLERQRLAPFGVEGPEVNVDDRPAVQVSEFRAEAVDVIVGAADLDHGSAVGARRPDFARLQTSRDEDHGAQPGARRVGSDRAGQVPGGGTGERVETVGEGEIGSDRDVAILERPGRVQGVVFQVKMVETEFLPEVARLDQRGEAGSEVDRLALRSGQELAVAPD